MTLTVATRTLALVTCYVGDVGCAYSEAFASGLVMWQKPAAYAVLTNSGMVSRGASNRGTGGEPNPGAATPPRPG
jgi:hypothetical protein